MLYFAYGSNLAYAAMKRRCPKAVPVGKFALGNSRLTFRGVADCAYEKGSKCWGGVWRITPDCEEALDRFEGCHPSGYGAYRKEIVPIKNVAGETELMFYVMNSTGVFPPSQHYLDVIKHGYRDFRLPMSHLRDAVKTSWDKKNPSHVERKRYRRTGRPMLAHMAPPKNKAVKTGTPTTGNLFGFQEESA